MTTRTAGRLLAALVGFEWFFALIFGGWGLLFGPLAVLAGVVGRRQPRLAGLLLLGPVVVLVVSWLPVIFSGLDNGPGGGTTPVQALLVVAVLTLPAVLAAWLIAGPLRRSS